MKTNPLAGLALLGLPLLLTPVLFCPWNVDPFEPIKLLVLALSVGVLLVLFRLRLPSLVLLDWGILVFAASAAVSTFTSVSPWTSLVGAHESFLGLHTVAVYGALYFAARALLLTPQEGCLLLKCVIPAAAVASAYGLVQAVNLDPLTWTNISNAVAWYRPASTLGHPNHLAAYLTLTVPLITWWIWEAWQAGRRVRAGLLTALAVSELLVVVLCLARAAWLALAAMLLFAALVTCRSWRIRLPALILAALALASPLLAGRMDSISARMEIWSGAWQLFLDRPVVGQGLDTFAAVFPAVRSPAHWRLDLGTTPFRAHNLLLQVLATQGLFGLAGLGLLTVGVVRGLRRIRREWPLPMVLALAALLLGHAVISLFSFTTFGCGTLVVLVIGLVASQTPAASSATAAGRSWHWLAATVAALLLGLPAVQLFRAELACASGDRFLYGNPLAATTCYEKAVRLAPCQALYRLKWAAAARSADQPWQPILDEVFRLFPHEPAAYALKARSDPFGSQALGQFDIALALDPCNARLLGEAAALAAQVGSPSLSAYLERGLAAEPEDGRLLLLRGALALDRHQWSAATKDLEQAVSQGQWFEDQHRHTAQALLARAYLSDCQSLKAWSVAHNLLLERPDWPEPGPRLVVVQALRGMGKVKEAEQELRALRERFPSDRPPESRGAGDGRGR